MKALKEFLLDVVMFVLIIGAAASLMTVVSIVWDILWLP